MKKSAVIVCVLLVVSLLAGCLKDEVGGVRLVTDSSVEVYSVPRQVASFLFHSGGPWTATADVPWLKVVKENGPGGTDTLIIVTTEKNLTGAPRTALVTVESGGQREVVNVKQSEEYAVLDVKEVMVPAEGGLLDVKFRTNVADSLQLYVSSHLAQYLVDTRDSTAKVRGEEKDGTLGFLKVLPNDSTGVRLGLFFLSIKNRHGGRLDLDTLLFSQPPLHGDSTKTE